MLFTEPKNKRPGPGVGGLALLLALAAPAFAEDESLMRALRFEMQMEGLTHAAVLANKEGAALAASLAKPGKLPGILFSDLEHLRGVVKKEWNAMYYRDAIYINKSRMLRYFGAEGVPEEAVDWAALLKDQRRKKAAARELAFGYFHELVHLRQAEIGDDADLPQLESELEAFLRTSLFFQEEMRKDPALLARYAAEPVYGKKSKSSFASSAAQELFWVCLGKKGYRDYLAAVYRGSVAVPAGPVDGDDPRRRAFVKSVEDLFDRAWPRLWLGVALTGGRAALAAGSYPRALRCMLPKPGEAAAYGLAAEELKEVRAAGEQAMAAALGALRAGEKGDFEMYAYIFREVEEAHARLGRALPPDIAAMRPGLYARAGKFYSAKAAAETSAAWRGYLRNQEQYFTSGVKGD